MSEYTDVMGKKDRWQHNFDKDFSLKRFCCELKTKIYIELHIRGFVQISPVSPPQRSSSEP